MKSIPIRHIHNTLAEPDLLGSFNIRDVERLIMGNSLVQELHRHDYFYVLALEKGSGSHEIDFVSYEICDNGIFFMRPGQVHQLTLNAGSRGYLMQFKADFYNPDDTGTRQLLRKASHKNLCRLDETKSQKLLAVLSYIFQEYTDKQEGYREIVKANLNIFFIELIRNRQNRDNSFKSTNTYVQERLEEFLALLEIHIATTKQVSQYTEMMNLSIFQLNAITKETVGKTCSELINESIILEAKRYLLATSNQVSQIADHLGYEDISYFIRFFKKHTNYTPEAFRNNFK